MNKIDSGYTFEKTVVDQKSDTSFIRSNEIDLTIFNKRKIFS